MKSAFLSNFVVILALLVSGTSASSEPRAAEPLVLARVELTEAITHALPAYAQLQDGAGNEYALVLAPLSQVEASGVPHRRFETAAHPSDYVIARGRRPAARADTASGATVVYDDGRQVIARATLAQAQALAESGFDLRRLTDAPLLWRQSRQQATARAITPDPAVASMIAQVQASELEILVGELSGEWPATVGGTPYTIHTRDTASGTPIQKATQYAYERMQASGLAVSYQDWSLDGLSNRNVVGEIAGATRPDEIVVISAHLDSVSWSGAAPGADDNASGCVGVLTVADILGQQQFERTVRFVLFTGEEQGLYGSDHYAASAYAGDENIVANYNMDMIAWDQVDGPTLRLHTRRRSNPGYGGDVAIASLFVDVVSAYGLSDVLTPIITADGEQASDQASFWYYGYAGIIAIEDDYTDFNDNYHTSEDRLAVLDLDYFTNFVKASVGTAAHLASGTTPTPGQAACTSSPAAACATAGRSVVKIKSAVDPAKNQVQWKWSAASAAPTDFGNPVGPTGYALCVYEDGVKIVDASVDADAFDWYASRSGFKYKSVPPNADGVSSVVLKSGTASASIRAVAKGLTLVVPTLPLATPANVTVQLIRGDAALCWESSFTPPYAKDDAEQFRASEP